MLVPIMAVIYVATVLILIVVNVNRIPWFFYAVFTEAFKPEAVFGGAFGVALIQGVKRGLMKQGRVPLPCPQRRRMRIIRAVRDVCRPSVCFLTRLSFVP